MATPSGSTTASDLVTDLITRYGRQAIQLFAALAGATGLFYSIGFIIVNVNLLRLGLYETALISVGYVAPGVAFAILLTLIVLVTISTFAVWRRILRVFRLPGFLVVPLGVLTLSVGALLLGYLMWFGRNVAMGVVIWSAVVGLGVAILAYAEYLPGARRMFIQRHNEAGDPLSPVQARLKSPSFLLVAAGLSFIAVLVYGQLVYDQVPPVFGGGLPIVVRFFGEDVKDLDQLGISLEPGQANLTERVELIAQTEDRYIIRVADRALSFDKLFVQGIRYEPPEFFLDRAFFLASHTRQGERFLADERYDQALSEFNLVLDRDSGYVPALRGRVRIVQLDEYLNLDQALDDYRTLTQREAQAGDNFYGLATVEVRRAQALGQAVEVESVVTALTSAKTISTTLGDQARADPVFDPLRGVQTFDVAVYGSGPAAARWFADAAQLYVAGGANDKAIVAYQRAIDYTDQYAGDPQALSVVEVAELHLALGRLYDPLSDETLTELQAAVDVTGQTNPVYLIGLAEAYLNRGDTANALTTYDLAFTRSTADTPNRRQALLGLGQAALQEQDYLRASAAFQQALALSESDAETWYDYARALAALGDDGVATALRRAIELDAGLALRAQTDDWAQYFSGAGSAVKNLIDGAVAVKQARDFRDQGDLDKAIAAYRTATAADGSVFAYWVELGDVLVQAGLHADAAAAYQAALLRLATPNPEVLVALGAAQIESGDATGAIASLTQAITAQGNAVRPTTYALLGRAYLAAQQYDQAAAAYDQAAVYDPITQDYPYQSGIASLLAGQIERGLAALENTITQGGLSVEASDAVGLRDTPSLDGAILRTLAVGTLVRITAPPEVPPDAGQVWWPVADQDGTTGWVNAVEVGPTQFASPIQSLAP